MLQVGAKRENAGDSYRVRSWQVFVICLSCSARFVQSPSLPYPFLADGIRNICVGVNWAVNENKPEVRNQETGNIRKI